LFEVREAQASTTPQKAVLVFNHCKRPLFAV
jgi:hypothetical protein